MRWPRAFKKLRSAAKNAAELLRKGRLSAPYQAPFEVVKSASTFRLRHYSEDGGDGPPLLLVPPLMVSAEIYDISPELSAVSFLAERQLDVWVVDFGRPEKLEGGLSRTLDDHVLAVDACIDEVRARTGADVHVAGYSQGGMFAYQCAAFRESRGIASLITFGSPVDMRRMAPVKVHGELAERFLRAARAALSGPISNLEGLPKELTARGFKLLSASKEIRQLIDFFGMLHDRERLEKAEVKRRFLGGEGFVAWPGPALSQFFEEVIVENRMTTGGFVLDGRPVSLASITCPVLVFVGTRDDLARPPAVRAIAKVAVEAPLTEVTLEAGHFGLVVGTRSLHATWPKVVAWARAGGRADWPEDAPRPDGEHGVTPLYDLATDVLDGLWNRMGDVSLEVGGLLDTLRWQLPRLARLRRLKQRSRVSLGRVLSEQAAAIPEAVFFLWKDQAFTYAEADARVNQLLAGLVAAGVQRGRHVGVQMRNHPDLLTAVVALNRLGAVAVLLAEELGGEALEAALAAGAVDVVLGDDAGAAAAVPVAGERPVLCLGRGAVPAGARDLAKLLPEDGELPPDIEPNPGRADELALLLFTAGSRGRPKAARITNRRWALAALATAAACRLTSADTVYCCLPLCHMSGLLLACGGALAGGARLALAPRFAPGRFWGDVRRYGATVSFSLGEMGRLLLLEPATDADRNHPLRMLVASGLRRDVWVDLLARFGPLRILEFYASTEGNVALANLAGDKPGSVGRPFPEGSVRLVAYDPVSHALVRRGDGRLQEVSHGGPGVLLAEVSDERLLRFEGYLDDSGRGRLVRDAFAPGDCWFDTGDVLRRDGDGDYWFVDRLAGTFRCDGENVSSEEVERALRFLPEVALAACYGLGEGGERVGVAAIALRPGAVFDGAAVYAALAEGLTAAAQPRVLRIMAQLPLTASFRIDKRRLEREGIDPARVRDPLYVRDVEAHCYRLQDAGGAPA